MNTSVRISDSAHMMVLLCYALLAVLGGVFQSGAATAQGLEDAWPHWLYATWASVLLLSGVACFVAALMNPRMPNPRDILIVELVGCAGLALTCGAYEWSLLRQGFDRVIITQIFATAFAVGAAGRAVQIGIDLWRLRKARLAATRAGG